MPSPGYLLLQIIANLYTLRMIWNHGHQWIASSIFIVVAVLEIEYWREMKK